MLPDVVVPVGPDPSLVSSFPPEYYRETEERSREALGRALDPAWGNPAALEMEVRWGDAVAGIIGYADTLLDGALEDHSPIRPGRKNTLLSLTISWSFKNSCTA